MRSYSHEGNVCNYTNTTADTINSGDVFRVGTLNYIAVADIPPGEVGAAHRSGVFKFAMPTILTQGDPFRLDLATQLQVATGGVVIGDVDEVLRGVAHVLLNNLPGSTSTR